MTALKGSICKATTITLGRSVRALRLENDLLMTTVLLDKGADIYELFYKPKAMDVLWKSPWGMREPGGYATSSNSAVAWLEAYAGGWQEIFPSGGGPAVYKNVELNFHGEASMISWDYEITEASDSAAEVVLSTRLFRSPFRIERRMRVEAGKPVLSLNEIITNESGEQIDYMWGHHPAYGAPFLSGACRVDTGATKIQSDDSYAGFNNPFELDQKADWSEVSRDGSTIDLSQVPDEHTPRDTLAYLSDFSDPWYGITNTEYGFGVGMVWDASTFPYAWFWQEMNSSLGHPWYKSAYVMAIEPFSSIPGQGLTAVMEKTGSQRTLQPGESHQTELRAVFYESSIGISKINSDGTVITKD